MILIIIMAVDNEEDRQMLLDVYYELFPVMVKISYDIVHDRQTAHDLAQDTVVKLIDKIDVLRSITSKEKLAHYVKTATARTAINYYNLNKRRGMTISLSEMDMESESFSGSSPSIYEVVEKKDQFSTLGSVIRCLSEKQRRILYYKYYLGLSSKEIAKELKTSDSYVDVCISRAKKMVRKHYETEGLTDNGQ